MMSLQFGAVARSTRGDAEDRVEPSRKSKVVEYILHRLLSVKDGCLLGVMKDLANNVRA